MPSVKPRGRSNPSLPVERPFTIFLNDEELVTTMATPGHLVELAAGFLWTSGLIAGVDELGEVHVKEKEGIIWATAKTDKSLVRQLLNHRLLTAGCGGGAGFASLETAPLRAVASEMTLARQDVTRLMAGLLAGATLYRQSGGIHGSALARHDILFLAEDIGRHNTVDKVLGWALLNQVDTGSCALVTTGRISSEMLLKAARASVPILISRTSPTDLAIELAEELKVTVIGYARSDSFTVYTEANRVGVA